MIKEFILKNKATLLCVGPMSRNCILASTELSKQYEIPQILIASRRQIDSEEFGGGYVEGFSTHKFAEFVKEQNAPLVYLARDHGGPWQSILEVEENMDHETAMKSAKRSFESDVEAGFKYIHIDPSVPIQGENLTVDVILSRLCELYGHVDEFAKSKGVEIRFELGTEEQDGYGQDLEKFEYFLSEVARFCEKQGVTSPDFVVAQTGTKVMEMRNVGIFGEQNTEKLDAFSRISETTAICSKYGVMLKEHNGDYLSADALALRPILGIHATNVAPEFGVVESQGLLYLLRSFGLNDEIDLFMNKAIDSGKWKKWMVADSSANEFDKALICGHYVFNSVEVREMRKVAAEKLLKYGVCLEECLKDLVKISMVRYMHAFKMI